MVIYYINFLYLKMIKMHNIVSLRKMSVTHHPLNNMGRPFMQYLSETLPISEDEIDYIDSPEKDKTNSELEEVRRVLRLEKHKGNSSDVK